MVSAYIKRVAGEQEACTERGGGILIGNGAKQRVVCIIVKGYDTFIDGGGRGVIAAGVKKRVAGGGQSTGGQ